MNLRLIGGEMLVWSDLDGRHGPGPVRGPVLAPLLAAAHGRTLVAGPHEPDLIDALPAEDLTLFVRGVPDAEALAARYADRPGVTVCCGGVEKLAAEPPYDTVVALDGLARLSSVEGSEPAWGEAFDILLAALRPGGTLLLAMENFLGLHRLVAFPPAVTDADWAPAGAYDITRPAGLARVRGRLEGAGLGVTRTYAAYPAPIAPTALIDADILADDDLRGFLDATLRQACRPLENVLTDLGRLAVESVRHGAAAALAPAWILLAGRDGSDLAALGRGAVADTPLPDALIADGSTLHYVHRHEAPLGRTLEDLLIGACLRRDMPAVRELLGAWQAGAAAGVPADQVVVGPGGTLTALAAAGEAAAALRGLAATFVGGGFAHPWPTPADAADLALTLAAMAGREVDPAAVAASGPQLPDGRAVDELAGERDRLATQLAEARAKAQWYEQRLTARDDALNRAQRVIELLTASGPAQAGKALVGGAMAARRTARAIVRRVP